MISIQTPKMHGDDAAAAAIRPARSAGCMSESSADAQPGKQPGGGEQQEVRTPAPCPRSPRCRRPAARRRRCAPTNRIDRAAATAASAHRDAARRPGSARRSAPSCRSRDSRRRRADRPAPRPRASTSARARPRPAHRTMASTACQESFSQLMPAAPPSTRSTRRPAMPTMMTSSAATIEPATSAAQMSMVWL